MFVADGHDRQAIALANQNHILKARLCLELGKRDRALEFFYKSDIHELPAWIVGAALGVEVVGFRVELGGIRVGLAGHFHDADDAYFFAVRVVEKYLVTDPHVVTHHVARLVVANTVPGFAPIALEIIDAVDIGLGFHQPVCHVFSHACAVFIRE